MQFRGKVGRSPVSVLCRMQTLQNHWFVLFMSCFLGLFTVNSKLLKEIVGLLVLVCRTVLKLPVAGATTLHILQNFFSEPPHFVFHNVSLRDVLPPFPHFVCLCLRPRYLFHAGPLTVNTRVAARLSRRSGVYPTDRDST